MPDKSESHGAGTTMLRRRTCRLCRDGRPECALADAARTRKDGRRTWIRFRKSRSRVASPVPPPERESGGPRGILARQLRDSRPQMWPGRGSSMPPGREKGRQRPALGMCENILAGPAGKIQPDPVGQEAEAGRRQARPAPRAPAWRRACSCSACRCSTSDAAYATCASVSASAPQSESCCCLERSMPSSSSDEILQAVLVGVGAGEPRGDLGAVDRPRHHAQSLVAARRYRSGRNGRSSESPDRRGACVRFGALARAGRNLHHVGRAVAGR